ncbi:MAG: methylglyoxal synthase [Alphaproteobacteria bacterium]|nr:methylglyoxal synthase [Alphaproteobacteria bacterium]
MKPNKRIGLVAHDAKKRDLLEWVDDHRGTLERHELWGTGTTGGLVADRLGLPVHRLKSGPLGGDQQMGALIAEGRLDVLIFFTDPLSSMPHDVDVKALVRLSTVYGIAMACNRTTADFLIASPLFNAAYEPVDTDYSDYISRQLDRI